MSFSVKIQSFMRAFTEKHCSILVARGAAVAITTFVRGTFIFYLRHILLFHKTYIIFEQVSQ